MTNEISDDLLVERMGAILVLTFNRPKVRNALSLAGSERMVSALQELDQNEELRVAILTGVGGHFCSGMDLKAFLRGERPYVEGYGYGGLTERPPRKPLIAAVEGYALAGGFEMALACDLIVASESARFGLPEAKRGIVAAAGGLMNLPRRIPYHIAMQYALTGDLMTAERAVQLGLVNELVKPGQALGAAMELARRILENSPLSVAVSKQVVSQSREWPLSEMFVRQSLLVDSIFSSEDAREGASAFAEKRLPRWTGR